MIFLSSFLNYWKQIVVGLILCVTLYYKIRYGLAVQELEAFKAEIATNVAKQETLNAIKEKAHLQEEVKRGAAYSDYIKQLKDYYAKLPHRSTPAIPSVVLRDEVHNSSGAEIRLPTEVLAESRGYEDAVLAGQCAETTADYNELYNSWKAQCAVAGGCLD